MALQNVEDLHEAVVRVRRVLRNDVMREFEHAQSAADFRAANQNLKPVRTSRLDADALTRGHRPTVSSPDTHTIS